jgi:hypothetical protein
VIQSIELGRFEGEFLKPKNPNFNSPTRLAASLETTFPRS